MEVRGDRIHAVREIVGGLLEQAPTPSLRAGGYVHMFGVEQACALIAMKRGEDVELASIAGILHDIASYTEGYSISHARRGAQKARRILEETGLFSADEIKKVFAAIWYHSDKAEKHGPLEEILKDADVMQHCLFNPGYVTEKEKARYAALLKEFGISAPVME